MTNADLSQGMKLQWTDTWSYTPYCASFFFDPRNKFVPSMKSSELCSPIPVAFHCLERKFDQLILVSLRIQRYQMITYHSSNFLQAGIDHVE